MVSLKKLRGEVVFPSVSSIIENATAVDTKANFGKITTPTGEYYYILRSEESIEATPEDYKVVKSSDHDALFIVPIKGSGGFSGKF